MVVAHRLLRHPASLDAFLCPSHQRWQTQPSFQAETQIIVVLADFLRLDNMGQRQLDDLLIAVIQRSGQMGGGGGEIPQRIQNSE